MQTAFTETEAAEIYCVNTAPNCMKGGQHAYSAERLELTSPTWTEVDVLGLGARQAANALSHGFLGVFVQTKNQALNAIRMEMDRRLRCVYASVGVRLGDSKLQDPKFFASSMEEALSKLMEHWGDLERDLDDGACHLAIAALKDPVLQARLMGRALSPSS